MDGVYIVATDKVGLSRIYIVARALICSDLHVQVVDGGLVRLAYGMD